MTNQSSLADLLGGSLLFETSNPSALQAAMAAFGINTEQQPVPESHIAYEEGESKKSWTVMKLTPDVLGIVGDVSEIISLQDGTTDVAGFCWKLFHLPSGNSVENRTISTHVKMTGDVGVAALKADLSVALGTLVPA